MRAVPGLRDVRGRPDLRPCKRVARRAGWTPRDLTRRFLHSGCARLARMACVLCGSSDSPTDEDVIPGWLPRQFDVQGRITVNSRKESGGPRAVATRRNPKVLLEGGLCKKCNNERLGRLEKAVKPILAPMARYVKPSVLDLGSQRLLAAWAVKTVYLLELAVRQQCPGGRQIEGYMPSVAEMGWLFSQLEQRPAAQI